MPSQTLLDMNQHNLTSALAEAHAVDLRRAAAHTTTTAPPRRHLRALALFALIATALASTGAHAVPIRDAGTKANGTVDTVRPRDGRSVPRASITFTNPLHRSRGPGAGAGLL